MKRFLSPIILLWVVTIVLCIITAYTVFDRVQADRSETIRDAQRENEIYCRAFEQDVSRSIASIDTMLLFQGAL